MKTKLTTIKGHCVVCMKSVRVTNLNRQKDVHTHPGNCRRLYHNYRMAVLRGRLQLADKHQKSWMWTRLVQGATKKTLGSRSAKPANKGRELPVRPSGLKKARGSFL